MIDLTGALPRDPDLTYCEESHPDDPEVVCLREQETGSLHKGLHCVPGTSIFWGQPMLLSRPERNDVKGAVMEGIDSEPATAPPTSSEVLAPRPLPDPGVNAVGGMHHGAIDTEENAAHMIEPVSGRQRLQVLRVFVDAGEDGRTDWENETLVPGLSRSSASTRRHELMETGWVIDSGRRRMTAANRPAAVWVLTEEGRQNLHLVDFSELEQPVASLRDFG